MGLVAKLMVPFIALLSAIFSFFPLRNRVAFVSRQGKKPSLDYRLLSDALGEELSSDRIVMCLSEPESKGLVRFAFEMTKQLWYVRTSKVCIIDGYSVVVCVPPAREGRTVIQLWHALGALKKFGFQSLNTASGHSADVAGTARMHQNYDVVVAAGPGARAAYAEAFGYGEDAVLPFGLPRIDYLLDPSDSSMRQINMSHLAEEFSFLHDGKRVVLYAPTLRKDSHDKQWLSRSLEALARGFSADDTHLVIAGHPLDSGFDSALLDEYPVIKFAHGASTVDLLGFADCVVTDYSAIAFEAALLRREVYFYVPDIEHYRVSPGLNIDPLREFSAVSSEDSSQIVRMINAHAARDARDSFLAFSEWYFEDVGFGCTRRLARFVCDALN